MTGWKEQVARGVLWCPDCREERPLQEFWKRTDNRPYAIPYQAYCKKHQVIRHHLRTYQLTLEQYEELMAIRRCEICGSEKGLSNFDIDHCHEQNIIRGVLCTNCNNGLGRFKHNTNHLRAAIAYLEKEPYFV